MAKFGKVLAEGNLGGGIYTSSPFSTFSDVVVRNNYGPGIVDGSADGLFEKALLAAISQGVSSELADKFRRQTGELMEAVHQRDRSVGLKQYERLIGLADSHVSAFAPLVDPIKRVMISLGWL